MSSTSLDSHSTLIPKSRAKAFKFDVRCVKKFNHIFRNYLSDQNGSFKDTIVLFVFVLLLSILEQFLIYNIGIITSVYYAIMGKKDLHEFAVHTVKCIFLVLSMSVVKSCKNYVSSSLQIIWRNNLTKKLHDLYFVEHSYYDVNVLPNCGQKTKIELDNPDQRMTQDVSEFTKYLSSTVTSLLIAPFTIVWYSYKSYATTGYVGPLGCFSFFILSTLINKYLLSLIVDLVYAQERSEGFFRAQHFHVRNHAESIAFMSGGKLEKQITDQRLNTLLGVQERIMMKNFFLNLSVNTTDYIGSIVSFMVLAVPLFSGAYDSLPGPELSQLISANVFVSITLIYSFTNLVDLSSTLSIIAGNTHRIHQLAESLEAIRKSEDDEIRDKDDNGHDFFNLSNVRISKPSKSGGTLLRDVDLRISGDSNNILIWGPSGSGKTALLRVLKGLWRPTRGKVSTNYSKEEIIFVPQKSVMSWCSLKQQLTYPSSNLKLSAKELLDYLQLFKLSHLLDRIEGDLDHDVSWNWADVLSPGEMQRICFIRVLVHQPKFVFLDEPTSSVSGEMEKLFFSELQKRGINFATCGHQTSLFKFHDNLLEIKDAKLHLSVIPSQK